MLSAADTQPVKTLSPPPPDRGGKSHLARLLGAADLSLRYPGRAAAVVSIGFGSGQLGLEGFDVLPEQVAPHIGFYGLGLEPGELSHRRSRYPAYDGVLTALSLHGKCRRIWGRISIHWGDPRRNVFRVRGTADILLLEPEYPEQYPTLFSLDFLRRALRLLAPGGVLLAASDAGALRGALLRLGLHLGHANTADSRCRGTIAAWEAARIRQPLESFSRRLLTESTAGIPYRDTGLNWSRRRMLCHRGEIVSRMQARGLPARLSETS